MKKWRHEREQFKFLPSAFFMFSLVPKLHLGTHLLRQLYCRPQPDWTEWLARNGISRGAGDVPKYNSQLSHRKGHFLHFRRVYNHYLRGEDFPMGWRVRFLSREWILSNWSSTTCYGMAVSTTWERGETDPNELSRFQNWKEGGLSRSRRDHSLV